MNRFSKSIPVVLALIGFIALSGCSFGQTAVTPAVTPTAVLDVNVIMTNVAETAIAQFTQMAAQASPTSEPSQTPTVAPAATTSTPDPLKATNTQAPGLELVTPTSTTAGGQPVVETTATPAGAVGAPTSAAAPSLTPMLPVSSTSTGSTTTSCYNSKYVADVSIPDGTVFKPGDSFRKVWRIQNSGTCKWDQGFGLTVWAGPAMGGVANYFSSKDKGVEPGGIVDLGIDMIAPSVPGDYVAHWMMIDDNRKTFGGDFTVVIKVAK